MKTISPPISITISAAAIPASGSLSTIASNMAPGTWVQVASALNQNAVLGVGSVSGTMMHYAMSCQWNRVNRCIEIVGADHAYGNYMRYVRFDTASNAFVLVNAGGAINSGLGPGHEFNGTAVNPATGETYYRHYGAYTAPDVSPGSAAGSFFVTKAALNGTTFSTALPLSPVTSVSIAAGTCWWTGSFVGAGVQGCLVIFNTGNSNIYSPSANDGQILAYDPLSNSWFFNRQGMSPFYANGGSLYHEVMTYSAAKNCAVYGGGNDNPNKIWRLNADGSFMQMPDVPSGKALGIQRGNIVADPVTGNFLLLSAGELWELNPTGSGTWTRQTGARTPPANVGSPGPAPGAIDGIQSCAIPDYGVIAYIKQTSSTNGSFFLYKHA